MSLTKVLRQILVKHKCSVLQTYIFRRAILPYISLMSRKFVNAEKDFWKSLQGLDFTNIFRTKVSLQAFCAYILGLNILAQQYWRKCAHKMLVKLDEDPNVTNILHAAVLY
jgi:hypothetical protein